MGVDLPRAVRNPISLTGVAIATAGAIVFLVLLALELSGQITNPYAGLLVFVAVPAFFVLGLLLIPLGAMRQRRRIAAGLATDEWPVIDLRMPSRPAPGGAICQTSGSSNVTICGPVRASEW